MFSLFRRLRSLPQKVSSGLATLGNLKETVDRLDVFLRDTLQANDMETLARLEVFLRDKLEASDLSARALSAEQARVASELGEIKTHIENIRQLSQELVYLMDRTSEIKSKLWEFERLIGPFGINYNDGTVYVQTIHMNKFFVDAADLTMTPFIISHRIWEPEISEFVRSAVTPDSIFVDVGANFGYFTVLAGDKIGTSGRGRVIAIEPNPKLRTLLQKNLAINWSMAPVTLHFAAAGSISGSMDLFIPTEGAGNASFISATLGRGAAKDDDIIQIDSGSAKFLNDGLLPGTTVAVKTIRLDDIVPEPIEIDMMKLDVEGFEYDVLLGAENVISRSPRLVLIMEWSRLHLDAAHTAPRLLVDFFRSHRFRAFRVPPRNFDSEAEWLPFEVDLEDLMVVTYDNFVFRH